MRIRPTELGWKGLLLLASLEVAFLATAYSNLFFLLIAFCCVLGGLGAIWAWANLRPVQLLRLELAAAPAGQRRPVQVTLAAARHARHDIAVLLRAGRQRLELAHGPRVLGSQLLAGELAPRARGIEQLPVLLRSTFPFGLFAVTRASSTAVEVVTYPDPTAGTARVRQAARGRGELAAPGGAARSSSIAGLRPFRTGDAPGDVHWKASARRGTAVVKEREPEAELATDLVLDRRGDEATFERALSVATAHVLHSQATDAALRLLSQDARFVLGRDRGQATAALRWLAGAQRLPDSAPPPPAAPGAIRLGGTAGGRA